jgi:hypothetical protein
MPGRRGDIEDIVRALGRFGRRASSFLDSDFRERPF